MGLSAWRRVLLDENRSRESGSDRALRIRTPINQTLVNCTATSIHTDVALQQFASPNMCIVSSAARASFRQRGKAKDRPRHQLDDPAGPFSFLLVVSMRRFVMLVMSIAQNANSAPSSDTRNGNTNQKIRPATS